MRLKTVDNRTRLTKISGYIFKNCIVLEKLNLGSSLISVYGSFYNCGAELYVVAKNKYYKTVDGVLYTKNVSELINYPGLKKGNYKLPDKVIAINEGAFKYCHNLKSLTLNKNITEFRLGWLCGFTSLEILNLHGNLETVDTCFKENDGAGNNIYIYKDWQQDLPAASYYTVRNFYRCKAFLLPGRFSVIAISGMEFIFLLWPFLPAGISSIQADYRISKPCKVPGCQKAYIASFTI